MNITWTIEEEKYLKCTYGKQKVKEIAEKLGKKINSVYCKAQSLNLKTGWTDEENETLHKLMKRHKAKEIAEIMQKDLIVIKNKLATIRQKKYYINKVGA
jgi:hypothetical protein